MTSTELGLGPLETDIMAVLWRADGPLTARKVLDDLNERRHRPLAYTTVMTVLVRMAAKGLLHREPAGRAYRYQPVADDAAGVAVKGVIRDYGEAAVAHFLDEATADSNLRRRLEALLKARAQEPR